jgi:hypothetical protein
MSFYVSMDALVKQHLVKAKPTGGGQSRTLERLALIAKEKKTRERET